jgi:GT2 family glycosyltransferase
LSISVVIPAYNNWKHTHPLLFDIYNNFPQDTEIIVADDCSTDEEVMTGLNWWQTGLLKDRLRVIRNEKNVGFLRNSNFAVSKATNEIVVLISNDVKISDKTIANKLEEIFKQSEGFTLVGNRLLDFDTGWNTIEKVVYPYLEGYFLAFKKSEWLQVGGFDERFTNCDCEDLDLSTTYLAGGGKLVFLDAEMVHLGAQSYRYSPEREANTKANQERWREKWKS